MPARYSFNREERKRSFLARHKGRIIVGAVLFAVLAATAEIAFGLVLKTKFTGLHIGDLSTLLFGASSVALILYSLVITALAVFGWGFVQAAIEAEVGSVIDKEIKALRSEISGRHYSGMGFILGRTSYSATTFEVTDSLRLEDAIAACQAAVQYFDENDEDKDRQNYRLALINNLVFFLTLRGRDTDREFVLTEAEELDKEGWTSDDIGLVLTACRAILRYSTNPAKVQNAKFKLLDIRQNKTKRISDDERREASRYLEEASPLHVT
jgi:hypothetical protein